MFPETDVKTDMSNINSKEFSNIISNSSLVSKTPGDIGASILEAQYEKMIQDMRKIETIDKIENIQKDEKEYLYERTLTCKLNLNNLSQERSSYWFN